MIGGTRTLQDFFILVIADILTFVSKIMIFSDKYDEIKAVHQFRNLSRFLFCKPIGMMNSR